jgi:hypothetical protein
MLGISKYTQKYTQKYSQIFSCCGKFPIPIDPNCSHLGKIRNVLQNLWQLGILFLKSTISEPWDLSSGQIFTPGRILR